MGKEMRDCLGKTTTSGVLLSLLLNRLDGPGGSPPLSSESGQHRGSQEGPTLPDSPNLLKQGSRAEGKAVASDESVSSTLRHSVFNLSEKETLHPTFNASAAL